MLRLFKRFKPVNNRRLIASVAMALAARDVNTVAYVQAVEEFCTIAGVDPAIFIGKIDRLSTVVRENSTCTSGGSSV